MSFSPLHVSQSDEYFSRLLLCATHADKTSIKSPMGGIINIALADPLSFAIDPKYGYLTSAAEKNWVLCSLMGQTTYYSTGKIKQICVAPFPHGWYWMTALLADLCNHDVLYFQSFREGITFSNSKYETNRVFVPEHPENGVVAPIKGSLTPNGEMGNVVSAMD